MTNSPRVFAGLFLLAVLNACAAVTLQEPAISPDPVAEAVVIERADICKVDPDDGIGGTGCVPEVD